MQQLYTDTVSERREYCRGADEFITDDLDKEDKKKITTGSKSRRNKESLTKEKKEFKTKQA
jgi:hypothetical protein